MLALITIVFLYVAVLMMMMVYLITRASLYAASLVMVILMMVAVVILIVHMEIGEVLSKHDKSVNTPTDQWVMFKSKSGSEC